MPVVDLCRENGISDATFFKWRNKFGGMNISDATRLSQLQEENARLERLVGEQALDIVALKDALSRTLLKPAASRKAVSYIQIEYGYSERRACRVVEFNRCSARRSPSGERAPLRSKD